MCKFAILISLLFLSLEVFAKEICVKRDVSFKEIVESSRNNSLLESYKVLLKGNCNDKNLIISDKVGVIGGDDEVAREWILSDYGNGKFSINLAIGQHYFKFPEEGLALDKHICPNNIVSTGTHVFSSKKGNFRIVEGWSCGSKGCSYEYVFIEGDSVKFDNYCE